MPRPRPPSASLTQTIEPKQSVLNFIHSFVDLFIKIAFLYLLWHNFHPYGASVDQVIPSLSDWWGMFGFV